MGLEGDVRSGNIGKARITYSASTLLLSFAWLLAQGCANPEPITKLYLYRDMLIKFPYKVGDHFPETISSDPNRARIYYYDTSHMIGQGGWGQGELWLRLERSEVDKIYADFEKQAKLVSVPTNKYKYRLRQFHTVDYDTKTSETYMEPPPLPADFKIFQLNEDAESRWFRGAAISKKRCEVIYYAGYSYGM